MYHEIQKAILKGDYLKAAQICQEALDAAPTTPPLVSLFADTNDLLKALERCAPDASNDHRLWALLENPEDYVRANLSLASDAQLTQALSDPKAALADIFVDDDLWDAMTARGQETKAREFIRDDVDVSGLRRLLNTLEG